jgi:hypothetical protein
MKSLKINLLTNPIACNNQAAAQHLRRNLGFVALIERGKSGFDKNLGNDYGSIGSLPMFYTEKSPS